MKKYLILIILQIPNIAFAGFHSPKLVLQKDIGEHTMSLDTDYRYNEIGLYYRHYDLSYMIPLKNNFSTKIAYRSAYSYSDKWRLEKRPYIDLSKKLNNDYLQTDLRTRYEYRLLSRNRETHRNRNKITLTSNKKLLGIAPFVSNEFFYDIVEDTYNKNWLVGGVNFPKTKFGKFSLYYKHVTDKEDNNWTSSYAIVGKLTYKF